MAFGTCPADCAEGPKMRIVVAYAYAPLVTCSTSKQLKSDGVNQHRSSNSISFSNSKAYDIHHPFPFSTSPITPIYHKSKVDHQGTGKKATIDSGLETFN
ncbi:hypothetical protein RJ641_004839 [Dillenia turbinata]|uniref:Uncharacterized protein n=1 Tax=Dillenia turbinata TaxID=194707 RepID=A0AAN8Z6S1_9MAGN